MYLTNTGSLLIISPSKKDSGYYRFEASSSVGIAEAIVSLHIEFGKQSKDNILLFNTIQSHLVTEEEDVKTMEVVFLTTTVYARQGSLETAVKVQWIQ